MQEIRTLLGATVKSWQMKKVDENIKTTMVL